MGKLILPLLFVLLLSVSFAQETPPPQPNPEENAWSLQDSSEGWISNAFTYIVDNIGTKSIYAMIRQHTSFCAPSASTGKDINDIYVSTLSMTIGAILVAFLISLILYMVAKMLAKHDSPVAPYSYLALKGTDSIVSIVVFVLVFAAYIFVDGPNYIPLIRGMEYVSTVLSLSGTGSMFIIIMKFLLGYASNASIPLDIMSQMGARMISLSFDKVLSPVTTLMSILGNYSSLVIGEFMTKLGLLCFIRSSLFAVFLPIGFFLRGFGITKGSGNAILALAIAFFFFYPVTLTMNFAILKADTALNSQTLATEVWRSAGHYMEFMAFPLTVTLISKLIPQGTGGQTLGASILAKLEASGVLGTTGLTKVASAGVNLFTVMSKWSTVLMLAYLSSISIIAFNAIYGVIYLLVKLVLVYGIILTAIDIFATLMFAKELSGILGTPIELSTFMKIL
jgi:hypothetical protein